MGRSTAAVHWGHPWMVFIQTSAVRSIKHQGPLVWHSRWKTLTSRCMSETMSLVPPPVFATSTSPWMVNCQWRNTSARQPLTSVCYFHLWHLVVNTVRPILSLKTFTNLVTVFVFSCSDYSNSTLACLPKSSILPLQFATCTTCCCNADMCSWSSWSRDCIVAWPTLVVLVTAHHLSYCVL